MASTPVTAIIIAMRQSLSRTQWFLVVGLAAWSSATGSATAAAPPAQPECDGVATCTSECDAGKVHGCARLGEILQEGKLAPRDFSRSIPLFEKACDGGDGLGCAWLARLYDEGGRGTLHDSLKASALYKKACNLGALAACVQASHYSRDYGAEERRAFIERACAGGYLDACYLHGISCRAGDDDLCGKDEAQAARLFDQACAGGHQDACVELADLCKDGRGVKKDAARAARLYKRVRDAHRAACDRKSAEGCYGLGMLYLQEKGVKSNRALERKLFSRACDLGLERACYQ
jgi:TPR repeat protein